MKGVHYKIILTYFLSCSYLVNGNTNCDELGINFYEQIGCTKQADRNGCPTYDDCKYEPKLGVCLYHGQSFNDRESLDDKVQDESCNFGCICIANSTTKGKFICAQGQCGYWPVKADCYQEYSLTRCCGTQRCEPSTASCEVDGHTYKEGERFYPNDKCTVCICTPEFDGKYEGPYCKRQACSVELRHAEDIENNCAPLFYKREEQKSLCCPSSFICPSSEDTIEEPRDSESNLTCKYGDKTYKFGTTITRTVNEYGKSRTISCECKLPPLMTCSTNF